MDPGLKEGSKGCFASKRVVDTGFAIDAMGFAKECGCVGVRLQLQRVAVTYAISHDCGRGSPTFALYIYS